MARDTVTLLGMTLLILSDSPTCQFLAIQFVLVCFEYVVWNYQSGRIETLRSSLALENLNEFKFQEGLVGTHI